MKRFFLTSALAIVASASSAGAASISLKLVDSFQRSGPFGLAFDGTYIYWSQNNAQVHQMTTSGVDTGLAPFSGQVWSELAWDGSQLMSTRNGNLYKFDVGGGNLTTSSIRYDGLIDGLDYDQGDLWYSPDVDVVYRLSGDGTTTVGPNPFLGGAGGYSGVERIQATDKDYVVG